MEHACILPREAGMIVDDEVRLKREAEESEGTHANKQTILDETDKQRKV
jgi:hypothetical protein